MGLITKLKEVVKTIWDTVVEHYETWQQRKRYLQEREEYVEGLLQFDSQYHPEAPDIEILERIKVYIDENYPNGIEEKFSHLSDEELVEKFKQIVEDASEMMGVSIDSVNFYTPESESEMFLCGSYNNETNILNINLGWILSGNINLVKEQFYTLFHELKHALQWKVINNPDDYGYSEEQIVSWAQNWIYYIGCQENDEAYVKQPLELDTFGFEEVLKGEISLESLKS